MFILTPSLQWRIAIFCFGVTLMIVPDSLRFIARGVMALSVVAALFWLLRPISDVSYQPEDWLRWIDTCLSWSLLLVYAGCFGLIAISGGAWWSYLITTFVLSAIAVAMVLWTCVWDMLGDDLVKSST